MRNLIASLLLSIGIIFTVALPQAHAEETAFICSTEEATNTIASKIIINQQEADLAAVPFIENQICFFLPQEVHVDIAYHGKVFGNEGELQVEVVGFTDPSMQHTFYGIMPHENPKKNSI